MIRLVFILLVCHTWAAQAQILVDDPQRSRVGKKAAAGYFSAREKAKEEAPVQREPAAGEDRYLSIHVGTYINDRQYRWGDRDRADDVGEAMLGVTYRFGEWSRSMDFLFRAELNSYEIDGESPLKLTLMPIIAFPDARSDFPLYFGAGAGLGIFFEQVENESDLSFDYALIIGGRFLDLWDGGGLMVETGLKGQVNLLSSGQHDGVYLAAGGIFEF